MCLYMCCCISKYEFSKRVGRVTMEASVNDGRRRYGERISYRWLKKKKRKKKKKKKKGKTRYGVENNFILLCETSLFSSQYQTET